MSAISDDAENNLPRSGRSRTERISGRLDPALLERIDEAVLERSLKNRSDLIRQAVMAYLEMIGESQEFIVRVKLTPESLVNMRRLVELGEAESMGELIRMAVRDHLNGLRSEITDRNEALAYL